MSRLDQLISELCPDGVEYVELREAFSIKNGYTPSKSNNSFWENGTVPWFRMEDIRENGRILADSIQHISSEAIKGNPFPAYSIIVATSATIGEHALITVDSLANQRFTCLTRKQPYMDRIDPLFAYYYCFKLDEWCLANVNISSFPSVDMNKFQKFPFPLPPLPVQREIVRILDNFTELTAELTAELTTELKVRKKQYEYYRAFLFDLGDDVSWTTVQHVTKKVSSGGTPLTSRKEYYGGSIPWLRTQEVNFVEIYDTGVKITEEGIKNSSANWIPENCVIVAMYGATAAKVGINKIPLTTNQACCNLQIDESQALFRFVFHWLSSQYQVLKSLGQGSQSNINAKTVKDFPIPLPSLEHQEKIVHLLDHFDSLVNDISIGLPAEIESRRKQYEYYRDKLLTFKEAKA